MCSPDSGGGPWGRLDAAGAAWSKGGRVSSKRELGDLLFLVGMWDRSGPGRHTPRVPWFTLWFTLPFSLSLSLYRVSPLQLLWMKCPVLITLYNRI